MDPSDRNDPFWKTEQTWKAIVSNGAISGQFASVLNSFNGAFSVATVGSEVLVKWPPPKPVGTVVLIR